MADPEDRCAACGCPRAVHVGRAGYCRGLVGLLECKCHHFHEPRPVS